MKIKTEELSGKALDWAVATSQGWLADEENGDWIFHCAAIISIERYAPSVDWAQGGPLIEQHKVTLDTTSSDQWEAHAGGPFGWWSSDKPLIAAMRAIVASKLGEEVDVPDELIN
jgi:hypothetical protein